MGRSSELGRSKQAKRLCTTLTQAPPEADETTMPTESNEGYLGPRTLPSARFVHIASEATFAFPIESFSFSPQQEQDNKAAHGHRPPGDATRGACLPLGLARAAQRPGRSASACPRPPSLSRPRPASRRAHAPRRPRATRWRSDRRARLGGTRARAVRIRGGTGGWTGHGAGAPNARAGRRATGVAIRGVVWQAPHVRTTGGY